MTRDRHDATSRRQRDLRLGRALDELDVPDYPDDFLASVWQRIDDEDAQRLETPAAKIASGRRLRHLFARRPIALGLAAAIAAAAIIAVSLVGLPGGEKTPLAPSTAAAKLLSRIVYAMSQAHSLTGVLTQTEYNAAGKLDDRRSGPFAVRDDGSWRLQLDDSRSGGASSNGAAPQSVITGYDAARHLHWWFFFDPRLPRKKGLGTLVHNSDGRELAGESLLVSGFAAGVRAALAEGGPALEVQNVTYNGRPAWKAVIPGPRTPAASPPAGASSTGFWSAEVIVDQQTGLPVRVTQWGAGGAHHVWEMNDLRIDTVLPADEFASAIPAGVTITQTSEGLRFLSLDQARRLVGFSVPMPTQVPDGFRLGEVIVQSGEAMINGSYEQDPLSSLVAEVWRRGLDTFRVEVSAVSGSQSDASTARALAAAPAPQSAKLHGGLFDGLTAFTALGPNPSNESMGDFGPVLSVAGKGVAVDIFGDLTRQELLDVAASLRD